MAESATDIAAELTKLRNAYLERLPQEIAELAKLATELITHREEDASQRLAELRQRLHKLAGSGGTFGFPVLSHQASALEHTVQGWCAGDFSCVEESQRRGFAEAIAALAATFDGSTIHDSPPNSAVTKNRPCPPNGIRRIEVWLVEDDTSLGEALVRLLGQFGYAVRLHTRIDAVESALRLEHPDILIMDVRFFEENINATEAVMERPVFHALDCPLFFVSTKDDFHSRMRAVRVGAEGFLLKPLDIPQLVNRMEQLLDDCHATPFRVLIVDDDVDLARHFHLVLSDDGMEATVLNEPEKIIETVALFRPELILMDMYMPGYSGPELAAVIRQHDEWTSLPIVYLSAETDRDKQLQAMKRGADDFLTKPILDIHLIAAVRLRAARFRQLADLMSKDSLTGLLKHSRIKETIALELSRAGRSGKPLSVAMLDIDHFKKVNDTYGHAIGDRVIMALAHLLKQRLRKTDGIGRYGGEEFVAILPECNQETAFQVLNDIRLRFSSLSFQHEGREFASTLSAGIACTADFPDTSSNDLLVAADEALYTAKHGGRNQVRLGPPAVGEAPHRGRSVDPAPLDTPPQEGSRSHYDLTFNSA